MIFPNRLFTKIDPQKFPLLGRFCPRRIHLYCVGTAKSGTPSIASIFSSAYRVRHEPYSEHAIETILKRAEGKITSSEANKSILLREKILNLEVNSSQLNYFFLGALAAHYPAAKFLLTIRHPYSWLSSYINHQLGRGATSENWQKFRELRFCQEEFLFSPEEWSQKNDCLF